MMGYHPPVSCVSSFPGFANISAISRAIYRAAIIGDHSIIIFPAKLGFQAVQAEKLMIIGDPGVLCFMEGGG